MTSIDSQALAMALADVKPQGLALDQEAAQAQARGAADVGAIQGSTKALAGTLSGVAPATSAAYDSAAHSDAEFARGFADQLTQALGGANDQAQKILAQNGGGVQSADVAKYAGGSGAHDLVYGSGYIPATTLEREGAGFTAAAARLPATAALTGQQEVAQRLGQKEQELQGIANQKAQLEASIPSLKNKYVSQLVQTDLQNRKLQFDVNKWKSDYALRAGQLKLNAARADAEVQYRNALIQLDQGRLTAQQKRDFAQTTGYWVDDKGKLRPTAQTRQAAQRQAMDEAKQAHATYTSISSNALTLARQLAQGDKVPTSGAQTSGNPFLDGATGSKPYTLQPVSYDDAYQRLLAAFGPQLAEVGMSDKSIGQFVQNKLIAAGYTPPPVPKPLTPRKKFPGSNIRQHLH